MPFNSSDHHSKAPRPPVFGLTSPHVDPDCSVLRSAAHSSQRYAGMVSALAGLVGGIDALEQLNGIPLADDPFDWSVVARADQAVVTAVLAEIDRCPGYIVDYEYRTVVHRLLELVATRDPSVLRRGSALRTAAALVWLALRGNDEVARQRRLTAELVWVSFGVSNCAARGRALFEATGLMVAGQRPGLDCSIGSDVWLADVRFLHSRTRTELLRRRDTTIEMIESDAERRAASRPITPLGDGSVKVRARPVIPRWAVRTMTETGRAVVVATFGDDDGDDEGENVEVLALTIPDARLLVTFLQRALDAAHVSG